MTQPSAHEGPSSEEEPVDHAGLATYLAEQAQQYLQTAPRRLPNETGTTHGLARDQLATAQVRALLALNATLSQLVELLSGPPQPQVDVSTDLPAPDPGARP